MSSIDKFLDKKYKCTKHDEFYEEYLKEIGLNYIGRKIAKSMPAVTELKKISEEEYALILSIPIKSHTQKFIPGVESIQTTMDGRRIKNLFEIYDNKLIEYQTKDDNTIKIIREYFETEMIALNEFRGDLRNYNWHVVES